MNTNGWIKNLLAAELRYRTNLSNDAIERIIDGFMSRLDSSRRTIVPTYLTDGMYDVMAMSLPDVTFEAANRAFVAALTEYNSNIHRQGDDEVSGSFW